MGLCANGGVLLEFSHHRKPKMFPRVSLLRFTPWYGLQGRLETRTYVHVYVCVGLTHPPSMGMNDQNLSLKASPIANKGVVYYCF